MGDYPDTTIDKFKHAVRCFEADQRLWREGRTEELRGRVIGQLKEPGERATTELGNRARRGPGPTGPGPR